jgi:hypothetical protein
MKQKLEYKVDLTKTEGEGEFPCPRCGAKISPDEEPGETYDILDYVEKEDGSVEEIAVTCKKCRSTIHIIGFETLDDSEPDDDPSVQDGHLLGTPKSGLRMQ